MRDGERCWFVQLAEVPYFESEGNYVRLPLGGHEPLLPRSLNYLEQRLDPKGFFRASRQHIINLAFIAGMETGPEGRLVLQLKGGKEIEMSRRQSQKFRDTMSA